MGKEIKNLTELKGVREVATFVFKRVMKGKKEWSYGQFDLCDTNRYCDDEVGIIVSLASGEVFVNFDYMSYREESFTHNHIYNITDQTFYALDNMNFDFDKYTIEDVEYAIKDAVSTLRARFWLQVERIEDYCIKRGYPKQPLEWFGVK